MKTDILDAQRLRQEAENVQAATALLNASITSVLQQQSAGGKHHLGHAVGPTDELKNFSTCFTQRGLDITNAVSSSNQIKQRADSVTQIEVKDVIFSYIN
ncbi:hypothetical protein Btru_050373 [Bulinus truncatus]|nr:hypothetical protein Btru_050373 [Bulinus truncatus]